MTNRCNEYIIESSYQKAVVLFMKYTFSTQNLHRITDANINFYKVPFVHPRRVMREHDFIYVIDGEWELGQNDKIYSLTKDSLLILFAGNTHYGVNPCKAGTKTMYFHVSLEEGDEVGEFCDADSYTEALIDTSHNPNIKKLFANVVNYKLSGEQRKADLCFELLVCELTSQKVQHKNGEISEEIKNTIHRYPEKFFGNRELAKMMNVSVKTAETKFKAAFGKTIHQYMLEFKIREAKSYFDKFDEISVKEVAYNLGFCDEYHFSKQFLRYAGVSPQAYKKSRKS